MKRNHIERILGYPNYAIVTGNPYDCKIYVRKNNTWIRIMSNEERPRMTLTKNKKQKRLPIYGWIYRQYYGEIPPNYDIHHVNGDHDYNDISNLKMLSSSEHSTLHGKTRNSKRVFQKKNGKFIASYSSSREAAKQSGISQRYISEYINGKRDYAGGYEWEYIEQ